MKIRLAIIRAALLAFIITPITSFANTNHLNYEVASVANQVNDISAYMGFKPDKCLHFAASKASPRELFFQAVLLASKANKLFAEVSNTVISVRAGNLEEPSKDISDAEVLLKLKSVDDTLFQIRQLLHIQDHPNAPAASNHPTPINRLIKINQTLNKLLERKTLPSDTYRISSLSLYYLGEVVIRTGAENPTLSTELAHNAAPSDVFKLQLAIIEKLNNASAIIGLKTLHVKQQPCSLEITPDDVQTLSYIILSQVINIANQLGIHTHSIEGYYTGKKYPSDVLQRNTTLLHQVDALLKKLDKEKNSRASDNE